MAITSGFLPGDLVHARQVGTAHGPNSDSTQYLVTEFVVSGVNGSRLYGSVFYPQGLGTADGWEFELVSRSVTLPNTATEIDAVLYDDTVRPLAGKGNHWIDTETGRPIRAQDIKSFTLRASVKGA